VARDPRLAEVRYRVATRRILGTERRVVQTHSPPLARGQLAGVHQHLGKAYARLDDLQALLRRGRRRKPSDPASLQRETDRILSAQHLRHLVRTEVTPDQAGRPQLTYALDQDRLDHLVAHLFGRRLWITNRTDWDPEQVILAARSQAEAEDAFRQLHAERAVAWSPMWHWTDQKIEVHALYCVLGLILVRLLQHHARSVDDHREPQALIADLNEVTECLLLYPPAGQGRGRPRTTTTLAEPTPRQQRLLDALGAVDLAS
jgi:transposase